MITLIDYGVGNLKSFVNVYNRLNIPIEIAQTAQDIMNAERLILPGVGHFDHAMLQLNRSGMRDAIDKQVLVNKIPVIGICVGMQMMSQRSEEGSEMGLGWIDAEVRKLDDSKINQITKLPHMGWNEVILEKSTDLLCDIRPNSVFYFLHSYYFHCNDSENILATTNYGHNFTSIACRDNIYGIQFHPEKSHNVGQKLLENFSKI